MIMKHFKLKPILTASLLIVAVLIAACDAYQASETDVLERESVAEVESIGQGEDTQTEAGLAEETPPEVANIRALADDEDIVSITNLQVPLKASVLIGYDVRNSNGEELGNIEDLMVDLNNHKIKYAILAYGGFLNTAEKLFAIPLNMFRFNRQEEVFVLDIAEEVLENSPGFDQDDRSDQLNLDFDYNFDTYWDKFTDPGEDVSTVGGDQVREDAAPQSAQAIRLSKLLEYELTAQQGEDVGEIEDLLIDTQTMQVTQAVLSVDEELIGLAETDNLYAVPMSQLNLNPTQELFTFEASQAALENAPHFVQERWAESELTMNIGDTGVTAADGTAGEAVDQENIINLAELNETALKTSILIGFPVQNSQGQALGHIQDLMIGLDSEEIKYVILSFGGFFDIGDKLFTVPFEAFRYNYEADAFVINVNQEILDEAPAFTSENWPDTSAPEWDADFRDYWIRFMNIANPNTAEEAVISATEPAVKASELLEYEVHDLQNEKVADVEDLVIDISEAQVKYVVLSLDESTFDVDRLYAIQLNDLDPNFEETHFVYPLDRVALEALPSFTEDEWATDQVSIDVEEFETVD